MGNKKKNLKECKSYVVLASTLRVYIIMPFISFFKWVKSELGFSKKYHKLKEMKGKYKGERCFIVCTGPSLLIEDLERLKNEYTFSMNSIVGLFEKTSWRPTFYAIQDIAVYNSIKRTLRTEDFEMTFVADWCAEETDIQAPCVYSLNLLDHLYTKKAYKELFSKDAYKVVYDGHTITYSIMQLAVYMGFENIYLLGCDCNFIPENGRTHIVEHNVELATSPVQLALNMMSAYQKAQETSLRYKSFKIYNATRGGKLKVFPRINIDDIF